jgi:hypothetical protein
VENDKEMVVVDNPQVAVLACGMPVMLMLSILIKRLGGTVRVEQDEVDDMYNYCLIERGNSDGVTLTCGIDPDYPQVQ